MNTKKPIIFLKDDKIDAITVMRALNEIHITKVVYESKSDKTALC